MIFADALGIDAVQGPSQDLRHRHRRGGAGASAGRDLLRTNSSKPSRPSMRDTLLRCRPPTGLPSSDTDCRRSVIFGRHDITTDAPDLPARPAGVPQRVDVLRRRHPAPRPRALPLRAHRRWLPLPRQGRDHLLAQRPLHRGRHLTSDLPPDPVATPARVPDRSAPRLRRADRPSGTAGDIEPLSWSWRRRQRRSPSSSSTSTDDWSGPTPRRERSSGITRDDLRAPVHRSRRLVPAGRVAGTHRPGLRRGTTRRHPRRRADRWPMARSSSSR